MNCSQFTPCEGRTEIVDADGRLIWHNDDICMVFVVRDNAPVVLAGLSGYGMRPACELNNEKGAFPIVEVLLSVGSYHESSTLDRYSGRKSSSVL